MSYPRIAAHSAIFAAPLSPAEAVQNVHALLALPQVQSQLNRQIAVQSTITSHQCLLIRSF